MQPRHPLKRRARKEEPKFGLLPEKTTTTQTRPMRMAQTPPALPPTGSGSAGTTGTVATTAGAIPPLLATIIQQIVAAVQAAGAATSTSEEFIENPFDHGINPGTNNNQNLFVAAMAPDKGEKLLAVTSENAKKVAARFTKRGIAGTRLSRTNSSDGTSTFDLITQCNQLTI